MIKYLQTTRWSSIILVVSVVFGCTFVNISSDSIGFRTKDFRLVPEWKGKIPSASLSDYKIYKYESKKHDSAVNVTKVNYKKNRILCWILTAPSNHKKRAVHVKATWGKRCDTLLFMSSAYDAELPTVALPVKEGRHHLWGKTKEAFKYVYKNYADSYDWVLKADDDTYIIMENLRYMLRNVDPNSPIYYGSRFKPHIKQGYMSGGAGYVLSREAVRRFVIDALPDDGCRQDERGAEDVELGVCMELVGVVAGDTRDEHKRNTFFPFPPQFFLFPGAIRKDSWFWRYVFYPQEQGLGCCSEYAVSFHYIPPQDMYVFEYFVYVLRPHRID